MLSQGASLSVSAFVCLVFTRAVSQVERTPLHIVPVVHPPSRPPCHVWSPASPSWISPLRLYWLCITPGYLLPRAKASLTCCLHCCGMLPPPPLLSFSDSSWGYTHTWLFRRTTCRTITDFSSPVSSLQSSPCPQAPNRIQFPLMSPSSTLYKKAGDQPSTT